MITTRHITCWVVLALALFAGAALSASAQGSGTRALLVDEQFQYYTASELLFLNDYKGTDPEKDQSWRGFLEWLTSNTPPEQPEPAGPADGATEARNPVLSASAFLDQDGDTQAGSQWQVSTTPAFTSTAWDSGANGAALTWVRLPGNALAASTHYYWRVRYQDNSGDVETHWSKWSNEDGGELWSFTTREDSDDEDDNGNGIPDPIEDILGPIVETGKPLSTGTVKVSGQSLAVDGSPYQIRGVGSAPTPIGDAPWDPGYDIYRQEIFERDLPLLRARDCNTLRTWGKIDKDDGFLDACWNDGLDPIRVIAGFWIDPTSDFSSATVRAAITAEFKAYVQAYKDHPAILMWLPGGEVNYYLRGDTQKLHDWFTLLNGLGWAAYEVEGNTYHPVTTDFAADVWNGATYEQDLLTSHLGVANLFTDDAHLTGMDVWGFNCYRGQTFDVVASGRGDVQADLFAEFAERSTKPMWLSEFGVDAWNHGTGQEDQATQADWEVALWGEIATNSTVCVGGSVMAWSDEWWKNQQTGTAVTHDPGPWQRGDQPDGWSDEEYYGVVRVSTTRSADTVTPRLAYYRLGLAWGANWPPTCAWDDTPVADAWYVGDVRLDASATDLAGDDTIAMVEFEYSLDSTDGTDGTWQDCGPADTAVPYSLVWPSQPADGADQDVWLRARAIDTGWDYSAWVTRRIRVDNSYTGLIFDPHPGETGVAINAQLTLTFATVVTKPGGIPLTNGDLPALLSFRQGDADVPFTATVATVERAHTVITVTPAVTLAGITTYILTITGDLIDADQTPVPHASLTFTTTFGPPVKLVFRQQPGGGAAGVPWSRQPRVAVCDAQGNTVEDSAASVSVALVARSGTLAGTTVIEAEAGQACFADLWLDKIGSYSLCATSPELTSATSETFTIVPGALDHFRVEGVESPVAAGTRTSPHVTAFDAWDNVKTDYVGTVSFSSSDTQASLPLPYTFYAAENGVHIFGFQVRFQTAGSQWLRVVDGTAQGEQTGIVVLNGAPAAPVPVSPANDAWARVVATLQAIAFSDVNNSGHAASQWQVATDAEFADVVWDSGETTAGPTITVPSGALAPGAEYYWRVRYKDDSGDPASCWSAWSNASATAWHFVTSYPLPFTDDFATDRRWSGLSDRGRPAAPGWERDPATAGGGAFGEPDPASDHTAGADNMILGFALGADYPETMSVEEVISPALDCTGQSVVELSFWRWLGVDDNEWAHAGVYASNDGVTWTEVWGNGSTPVSDSQWTLVTYDITPVAANQPNVFVKFTMGPMFMAYPYCGWNIDDLQVCAGANDLAQVWLETSAAEVQVGENVQVNVYVQENSPLAQGFRGGPVDIQFDAACVQYYGSFYSSSVIRPPFNAVKTSGALQTGLINELGGVTTQSGLGNGTPVLYAVLTFRATAAGTTLFAPLPGSTGLSLGPPVGQVGTWRVEYGAPVSVTVKPYVPPPVIEVSLEGPGGAVCVGDAFDVKVWVRETSSQAHGFLGGPLDLYFDPGLIQYHGSFDSAQVVQPPYRSLGVTNGTLRETRIDELGGVTLTTGYGDGTKVLYAVLTFESTAVGTAEFRVAPGESGLALTQPVGQVSIDQIDYGATLTVEVSATPKAQLTSPPAAFTKTTSLDVTVAGYSITHYRYRLDGGSYGGETPVGTHITASGLAEGPHTLSVLGRNAENLWQDQNTPTTCSWTIDLTVPQPPSISSASPAVNSFTKDTYVGVSWVAGSDALSGIAGYSWVIDRTSSTVPSQSITGTELPSSIGLGGSGDGNYWLHVRACDRATNWSVTQHCGPWKLDTTVPVARAGGPYSFSGSGALSGTTSTDGGSGVASYFWQLVDNPYGAGTLSQPATAAPTFNAARNGTYRARLTVTDGVGLSSSSEAQIGFGRAPPVLESVVIEDGAATTPNRVVAVALELQPGNATALEYRLSEGPGEGEWRPLPGFARGTATVSHDFGPSGGEKTIYVTVRDADYRYADFTSAEAHAHITVDLGSWVLPITVTNANVGTICFGMRTAASSNFDDGIDERAASAPYGTGSVYFYLEPDMYWTDMRSPAQEDEWLLVVLAGPKSVALSWSPASVPADRDLTIAQLDGDGQEIPGTSAQMRDVTSVSVPAWTVRWFQIVCSPHRETLQIDFLPGWNLVSCPVHTVQTVGEVFRDASGGQLISARVWKWDPGVGRFAAAERTDTVESMVGYWVYCTATCRSAPVDGSPVDGHVTLAAGWNLLGPVVCCPAPRSSGILGPIWGWDGTLQAYRAVADGTSLEATRAYWIRARSPCQVDLGE